MNPILYIILTLTALVAIGSLSSTAGANIGASTVASAKTQQAIANISEGVAAVQQYEVNNQGQAPSASYLQTDEPEMPLGLTDPAAVPATPAKTASVITSGTDVYGNSDFIIADPTIHPASTLNGLPKFSANFQAPSGVCSTATPCTTIVDDFEYGVEGQ